MGWKLWVGDALRDDADCRRSLKNAGPVGDHYRWRTSDEAEAERDAVGREHGRDGVVRASRCAWLKGRREPARGEGGLVHHPDGTSCTHRFEMPRWKGPSASIGPECRLPVLGARDDQRSRHRSRGRMTQAPEDSQGLFGYSSCAVDHSGAVCHLRRSVNETTLGPVRWPDQHGRTRVGGDREIAPSGKSGMRFGLRACDHIRMLRARSSPDRRYETRVGVGPGDIRGHLVGEAPETSRPSTSDRACCVQSGIRATNPVTLDTTMTDHY